MSSVSAKGKNRLSVLHLVPSFAGGGGERQLALLALELCRLGVDVHVAFVHPGINLKLILDSNVVLHPIPSSGNHDPAIFLRILAVIRSVKPSLIQTWFRQMDVLGGMVAMLQGVPFLLSERSSALAYPGTWKNWLRLQIGRCAAAIVANSDGGAAYWGARPHAPRIAVIRNGLPLQVFQNTEPADPTALGLPASMRLILFAGRLSSEKNLDTLVEALDEVLAARPECAGLLFGDGELRRDVELRIAATRSAQRMRLVGYREDLWRWMRRAAVFVSISRFEGNPNTVLEAMAVGCPLVASDIPQHREILDETTALLCDPGFAADVASAIRMVLDDPAATNARAQAARRRCAEWSIEKASRQYLELYETLTSDRVASA